MKTIKILQLTKASEHLANEILNKIYKNAERNYCNDNNFNKDSFEKAKTQMMLLLKKINEQTQKKYKLFQTFEKKVGDMNFRAGNTSKDDTKMILEEAKKTLERNIHNIIKNYSKVDANIIDNYTVNKCSVGANSNIKLAVQNFIGVSSIDNIVYISKEEAVRALVAEFVIDNKICPNTGNEIHYVNLFMNEVATNFKLEIQKDRYASRATMCEYTFKKNMVVLRREINQKFTNTFLNILMINLEKRIGAVFTEELKKLDDIEYLDTLQSYNTIFNCKLTEVGIFKIFEEDIETEHYSFKPNKEQLLKGWIVENLIRLGYMPKEFIMDYENKKYLFYGEGLIDYDNFKIAKHYDDYYILKRLIELMPYQNKVDNPMEQMVFTLLWKNFSNPQESTINAIVDLYAVGKQKNLDIDKKGPTTPLYYALENRLSCVYLPIIKHKLEINKRNTLNQTPLYIATVNDNIEACKALLEQNAQVNIYSDETRQSPFHIAIKNHNADIVELFLEYKNPFAKFREEDLAELKKLFRESDSPEICKELAQHPDLEKGWTSVNFNVTKINTIKSYLNSKKLHNLADKLDTKTKAHLENTDLLWACRNGNVDIVKSLINMGLDINLYNYTWKARPIEVACENGHLDLVKFLMSKKAKLKINGKRNDNYPAIWRAAVRNHVEIVNYLLDFDIHLDEKYNNESLLEWALRSNYELIAQKLIAKKFDIDEYNQDGITYLSKAIGNNSYNMVEMLLNNNADPCKVNLNGSTTILFAAMGGNTKIMELLIDTIKKVDKNKVKQIINQTPSNTNLITPLLVAAGAKHKNIDIVKMLIENGADLIHKNELGNNALAISLKCKENNSEISKLLITELKKYKNELSVSNNNGESAIILAAQKGYKDIVNILLQQGVDINYTDKDNNTALHHAAKYNQSEIVKYLIIFGANINAINKNKQTPLEIAIEFKAHEAEKILLNKENAIEIENFLDEPLSYGKI